MKIHIRPCLLLLATALMLMASCAHHPDVPSSCSEAKSLPAIFPDYCNVTVPCNIAPLNFMLPADQCVARLTTPDGGQQTYGEGVKVQIPESEWHAMLDASKGKRIKVEVWGKTTGSQSDNGNQKAGEWLAFTPFEIRVAEQPIDQFISYRTVVYRLRLHGNSTARHHLVRRDSDFQQQSQLRQPARAMHQLP